MFVRKIALALIISLLPSTTEAGIQAVSGSFTNAGSAGTAFDIFGGATSFNINIAYVPTNDEGALSLEILGTGNEMAVVGPFDDANSLGSNASVKDAVTAKSADEGFFSDSGELTVAGASGFIGWVLNNNYFWAAYTVTTSKFDLDTLTVSSIYYNDVDGGDIRVGQVNSGDGGGSNGAVPEPASLAVIGIFAVGLGLTRRRSA